MPTGIIDDMLVCLPQVNSGTHQDVVELRTRRCTCKVFQDMGIPCSHAMVTIGARQAEVVDYVEHWYEADMYRAAYKELIMPTLDRTQWQPPTRALPRILPPFFIRKAGRPRKS